MRPRMLPAHHGPCKGSVPRRTVSNTTVPPREHIDLKEAPGVAITASVLPSRACLGSGGATTASARSRPPPQLLGGFQVTWRVAQEEHAPAHTRNRAAHRAPKCASHSGARETIRTRTVCPDPETVFRRTRPAPRSPRPRTPGRRKPGRDNRRSRLSRPPRKTAPPRSARG